MPLLAWQIWGSNLVTHVSPTCICSQEEDFKGLAATLALLRQSPSRVV